MLESARLMQESLRRYVPGAIAEQIESGEDLEAGEREVTVLFVDLRSYTRYAEGREAKEIFSTINRFTDIVSGVVRAHGGCVVEFNGDGIMTVFGAPRAIANKELAAITAGREIFAAVRDMSDGAEGSDPQLSVGVGIATGQAYVGNVKAVDHLIWTAIGNTTNLAAQLESLTRDLDAEMVVDAATWAAASQGAGDWLHVGNTVIRGRSKPIDIYAVPLASSPTRR